MLPRFAAARYLQPLREGGSLPAVVDTEGGGLFVVKFRGAGQGPRALVAEILVGGVARSLGLPMPEMALVELGPEFGRTEPDPEIQDLLRASTGLNLGLRYLDGAFNYAAGAAGDLLGEDLATRLVWLDALTTNPDRTHRNPNLLLWQGSLWLIDHGAALYVHHDWASADEARIRAPFARIATHIALGKASALAERDAELAATVAPAIDEIVEAVPDELLLPIAPGDPSPAEARERYRGFFRTRLTAPRAFAAEAAAARVRLLAESPKPLGARR